MTSLVSPLAKRAINRTVSDVNITNYYVYSFYISEMEVPAVSDLISILILNRIL